MALRKIKAIRVKKIEKMEKNVWEIVIFPAHISRTEMDFHKSGVSIVTKNELCDAEGQFEKKLSGTEWVKAVIKSNIMREHFNWLTVHQIEFI